MEDEHTLVSEFDLLGAFDKAAKVGGITIPGYELVKELARGGMGAVYLAKQLRPEREVALKIMLPQIAEEPEMLARFQVEARAMASLDHPGILPVYEVGESGGTPFFSMKLVTGGTLATRLKAGEISPREAAEWMVEIATAVHFAHQHGVLHRDLKPANFLFDDKGGIYVSDFGLAKMPMESGADGLTQTESFFGTPHYMPPEVAGGSVASATMVGDLYSLGAVLYECLCGRRPHSAQHAVAALLRAIVDDPIPPPRSIRATVPRDLEIICMKALERDPAARYSSVAEFRDDLQRFLAGRAISARPVGWVEQTWRWAKAHPLSASLAGALMLTLMVGGPMLAISHRDRGIQLRLSLIDQARAERLVGQPGHRERALKLLRSAADMENSQEIRDEVIAVLAHRDLTPASRNVAPTAAVSLPNWDGEDPPVAVMPTKVSDWILVAHESGAVSLAPSNAPKPLRTWKPAEGREIKAQFTRDGKHLVLGEVETGLVIVVLGQTEKERVLRPLGNMITFLAPDPSGERLVFATAEGMEIISLADGQRLWMYGSESEPKPVRCAPAWSNDGTLLLSAAGDSRGMTMFEAATGNRRWDQPTFGWPTHLQFHPSGRLLACATDEPAVLLCDESDGRVVTRLPITAHDLEFVDGGSQLSVTDAKGAISRWQIEPPIGFREWKRSSQRDVGGTVFGMALSADGKFMLTTASGGVFIWSVSEERQTGFYAVENQRFDAPTAAWWLINESGKGRGILVQVPGGLEKLAVDERGVPSAPIPVDRPPGTKVVDVLETGDWIVTSKDPDAPPCQLWPMGDATKLREAALPAGNGGVIQLAKPELQAVIQPQDVVVLTEQGRQLMRLLPPETIGIRSGVFSADGTRLYLMGRDHRVFTWELERLKSELTSRKF